MYIKFQAAGGELTPELQKYTYRKLAPLLRRMPRSMRASARFMVSFERRTAKKQTVGSCKIVCAASGQIWTAEETTQHIYAALDIAVVQIEQQCKQYLRSHKQSLLGRAKNVLQQDWK